MPTLPSPTYACRALYPRRNYAADSANSVCPSSRSLASALATSTMTFGARGMRVCADEAVGSRLVDHRDHPSSRASCCSGLNSPRQFEIRRSSSTSRIGRQSTTRTLDITSVSAGTVSCPQGNCLETPRPDAPARTTRPITMFSSVGATKNRLGVTNYGCVGQMSCERGWVDSCLSVAIPARQVRARSLAQTSARDPRTQWLPFC